MNSACRCFRILSIRLWLGQYSFNGLRLRLSVIVQIQMDVSCVPTVTLYDCRELIGSMQFSKSRRGFWLVGVMDDGLWHFRRGHDSA